MKKSKKNKDVTKKNAPAKAGMNGRSKLGGVSALELLKQDHREVQAIFKEYRKLVKNGGDRRRKETLVRQACDALIVHAQIEEDIFYPALRREVPDQEMMDEALVEHDSEKDLIHQLDRMQPGDALYDAKFIVLGEMVKHHIEEEEGNIFPKAKKTRLNLDAVGRDLEKYKQELEDDMRDAGDRDMRDSAPQWGRKERESYRESRY